MECTGCGTEDPKNFDDPISDTCVACDEATQEVIEADDLEAGGPTEDEDDYAA